MRILGFRLPKALHVSMPRQSAGDMVFEAANAAVLLLLAGATLFPFLYIISVSVTPLEELARYGSFQIIPKRATIDAYLFILRQQLIPRAFMNSLVISGAGTAINLVLTTLLAYPLSLRELPFRRSWLIFVLVPMIFSGGIIPLFLLVKGLGMIDTIWSLVLPGAVSTYYLLIMRNFFQALPGELSESAFMDGANHFTIFLRIILPLSSSVMATMALFYAVGHWNGFFSALMFINDQDKKPLQVILRDVLMNSLRDEGRDILEQFELLPGQTLKMAAVVISVAPLLAVYPFVQKYFTKGVLIGSVKG